MAGAATRGSPGVPAPATAGGSGVARPVAAGRASAGISGPQIVLAPGRTVGCVSAQDPLAFGRAGGCACACVSQGVPAPGRAGGYASGARRVLVEEADPLVCVAADLAAADLSVVLGVPPERGERIVCVGVHGLERVAACQLLHAGRPAVGVLHPEPATAGDGVSGAGRSHVDSPTKPAPFTVLYTLRDHLSARLHTLHGCADAYAVLSVTKAAGGPAVCGFEVLSGPDRLQAAGLTAREAAVLALLLARLSDAEIAERLTIGRATVRTHCRAILRKLGLPDRRTLREDLLPAGDWSTPRP